MVRKGKGENILYGKREKVKNLENCSFRKSLIMQSRVRSVHVSPDAFNDSSLSSMSRRSRSSRLRLCIRLTEADAFHATSRLSMLPAQWSPSRLPLFIATVCPIESDKRINGPAIGGAPRVLRATRSTDVRHVRIQIRFFSRFCYSDTPCVKIGVFATLIELKIT